MKVPTLSQGVYQTLLNVHVVFTSYSSIATIRDLLTSILLSAPPEYEPGVGLGRDKYPDKAS